MLKWWQLEVGKNYICGTPGELFLRPLLGVSASFSRHLTTLCQVWIKGALSSLGETYARLVCLQKGSLFYVRFWSELDILLESRYCKSQSISDPEWGRKHGDCFLHRPGEYLCFLRQSSKGQWHIQMKSEKNNTGFWIHRVSRKMSPAEQRMSLREEVYWATTIFNLERWQLTNWYSIESINPEALPRCIWLILLCCGFESKLNLIS